MRIEQVIAPQAQPQKQIHEQQAVEPDLQPRGTCGNGAFEVRPDGAKHARLQIGCFPSYCVGEDVDLVSAGLEFLRAVIGAKRRTPGGVEGLWNDLQYAHASHVPISDQPRAVTSQELLKIR